MIVLDSLTLAILGLLSIELVAHDLDTRPNNS